MKTRMTTTALAALGCAVTAIGVVPQATAAPVAQSGQHPVCVFKVAQSTTIFTSAGATKTNGIAYAGDYWNSNPYRTSGDLIYGHDAKRNKTGWVQRSRLGNGSCHQEPNVATAAVAGSAIHTDGIYYNDGIYYTE